ncbi:methyltransferase family protein [Motilibacter peucedani]|uniref:Methyltransferase family protein n=1 Tax=Motilibacter peucedani TaxID=598650 RepID=A0A420XPE1_9ACTN|nr:methyltransferase domain-containing protein [Motilibacter peucedani]RKS74057.1 methyltransferase family protein [Motilibacter peucedani]
MEGTEVRKLAALEDRHWWYAERRSLLAAQVAALGTPGTALDVGAAGGGNTRVLRDAGWRALALEYGEEGAQVAHERGLPVVRGDATRLPVADGSIGLVVAFDVLEHIDDDDAVVAHVRRALRPGGTLLVAVPAGMRNWSAHDEAVGHVRRYEREQLRALLERGGLEVRELRSWNVLMAPLARWRRRSATGSDLDDVPAVVNAGARAVVALERVLPVGGLPGISLLATARRP